MATKPKPAPKPKPEPDPDEEDTAAKWGEKVEPEPEEQKAISLKISLLERVENLENRMTKLEAEAKEPPIRLGSARNPKPGWP